MPVSEYACEYVSVCVCGCLCDGNNVNHRSVNVQTDEQIFVSPPGSCKHIIYSGVALMELQ